MPDTSLIVAIAVVFAITAVAVFMWYDPVPPNLSVVPDEYYRDVPGDEFDLREQSVHNRHHNVNCRLYANPDSEDGDDECIVNGRPERREHDGRD